MTTPPHLEIDTTSVALKGRVGERLTKRVTISTEEARPVYAHASTNQPWLTFGPIKYLGNKVKIPLDIIVPAFPGQTVQAQVTIQGNGKQQFVVLVSVEVEKAFAAVARKPVPIAVSEPISDAGQADSAKLSLVERLAKWWNGNP